VVSLWYHISIPTNHRTPEGNQTMKCTSKIQAVKIAAAGARKMTDAQYAHFAPFGDETVHTLAKIGDEEETFYTLKPKPEGGFTCNCGFYTENQEFGVCKHGVYLTEELALQAWVDHQVQMLEDSYANAEF